MDINYTGFCWWRVTALDVTGFFKHFELKGNFPTALNSTRIYYIDYSGYFIVQNRSFGKLSNFMIERQFLLRKIPSGKYFFPICRYFRTPPKTAHQ